MIPTQTYTIDLHRYKNALYGSMTDKEMHKIFEDLKRLKKAYTSKDEDISRTARAEIDAINVRLRAANARLNLAPKAANVAKKRDARLQTVIKINTGSPRYTNEAQKHSSSEMEKSDEKKKGEGMSFGEAAEASRNSAAPSAASRAPKAPSAASRAPRASSAASRAPRASSAASSAASRASSASKRSSSAIRVSDLNKNVYLVPRTGIGKRRLAPNAGLAPIPE
jgi:chemotaxis protein histidine kinase CheA